MCPVRSVTYVSGPDNGLLGGRTRTRTLDPLIKSQLLYQLSYAPLRRHAQVACCTKATPSCLVRVPKGSQRQSI
jgi:hypothetical protein